MSRREVRALDSTQSGGFPGALALTGNSWHKMCPEEIRLATRWYHMMA